MDSLLYSHITTFGRKWVRLERPRDCSREQWDFFINNLTVVVENIQSIVIDDEETFDQLTQPEDKWEDIETRRLVFFS